jgi:hypothetical protein
MKAIAFWHMTLCSLVEVDRRFRGAYCLHHQCDITYRSADTISTPVWNIDLLERQYTAAYPRRLSTSYSQLWEPEISYSHIIYCYGRGWYHTTRTATTTVLLCFPIWLPIIPDSSSRALWQEQAETPSSNVGETWWEMSQNFAYKPLFYIVGIFHMP